MMPKEERRGGLDTLGATVKIGRRSNEVNKYCTPAE